MATLVDVIFLGTGNSGCIPNVSCLTDPKADCKVCLSSMTPEGRKNKRRNVSVAIRFHSHGDPPEARLRTVLIDCGKTFYESSIELFSKYGIRELDGIVVTHPHADAIFGLDDARMLTHVVQDKVDIYLTQETMDTVATTFPYLVSPTLATGGGDIAKFKYHIFDPTKSFEVHGLTFDPLPVHHGIYFTTRTPYICHGFRFDDIVYLSDTNYIPPETMAAIKSLPSRILVLDCLRMGESHASHFGLDDALKATREINAFKTYYVGFSHRMDHYSLEKQLKQLESIENLRVAPAFDGLHLDLASKTKLVESSYFTDTIVVD
ncbi:metallo-beta-lactamase family protein [Halteromyces radiatus]|uniref:metallo-beta-lactamase family protein n=1 Tax=Halteromyces radiatus TaxID=101107 RepID=UPI00222094B9|nr:metallo-beta-lactamase family protein [Halteromyces radiatus]KAI8099958.1 metallo-beta-lactamase family protein [Halteromyces radiatus]